tara:strand:+ start:2609 stop:4093 length:1485 start_codon:yes stop_codon:yes gene_type:complete
MLQTTKENFIYKTFIVISLLICPVVVIAPLGSWIPLAIVAISCSLFNKSLYKKKNILEIPMVIIITFSWIIINTILVGKNFFILEKFLYFFLLIIFGLIIIKTDLSNSNLKKIIVVFAISFILSATLIIVDSKIDLGIKLWLSNNLDSSNFKSFYALKDWTSLSDFRKNNVDQIISYNKTAYSRGIISLTVLALPLSLLCFFYNKKLLTYIILILNLLLAFYSSNLTVILSFFIVFFFGTFFYFQNALLKKYLPWFLGIYFLSCPFILGKLDYKKFSDYEDQLFNNRNELLVKYCGEDIDFDFAFLNRKKHSIFLYCNKQSDFSTSFQNENTIEKMRIFLNYNLYLTALQKLHRLMIWSYVKEKILEKPLMGHGFFSSRNIANEMRDTESRTKYQLIPLHPHNSILQIWLELGLLGIIIFFSFIKLILDKIYYYFQINRSVATITFMTFFQVLTIGQISFGFWQSWWLAIILMVFILYKYVFKCFKSHALQSNS